MNSTVQNKLKYSRALDNAIYAKSLLTVTPNAAVDPIDGAMTMDALVEDGSNNYHYLSQAFAAIPTGTPCTISCTALVGGRNFLVLQVSGGVTGTACFNLTDGTYTVSGTGVTAGSKLISAGVWRLWVTTSGGNSALMYLSSTSTLNPTYQGTLALVACYASRVQVVAANWPGPYCDTDAAPVDTGRIRDIVATQQNLIPYSEDYAQAGAWTIQNLIPLTGIQNPWNGALTATRFTDSVDGAPAAHLFQTITTPDAVGKPYTVSVFAQAVAGSPWLLIAPDGGGITSWFDLTNGVLGNQAAGTTGRIRAVPGWAGWYRCSVTWTPTVPSTTRFYMEAANGGVTYQGAGAKQMYAFGAQVSQTTDVIPYATSGATALNPGPGNPRVIA